VELNKIMKIESTVVIVKLNNGNCHQIMLTKSQQDFVVDVIAQLHNYSIKLNEDILTTIDLT
jgi:hypothetical protein